MRLLVDGLNTQLEEKLMTKGVRVEAVAKRGNPSMARHWILDPKQAHLFAVRGFVTKVGEAGKLRAFKVVDANDSTAARQEFTDSLGIITADFYRTRSGARGIGTGFGEEKDELLIRRKAEVGDMLTVMHVRYVEPSVLQSLQR